MNLFYELHKDIPREGPGNNESTRKAFEMIRNRVTKPEILDIGCGPGMQTIELASLTDGTILATDINGGFLEVLQNKVQKLELTDKVTVKKADMRSLPYAEGQFDVIWAEGTIFILGFEKGLREWRKFLKNNGILVASELSWIKKNPPKEPLEFWYKAYPEVGTVEENIKKAENLGYEVITTFVLPEEGWWEHYYRPLESKIISFREKYKNDVDALTILEEFQSEIDLYRNYSEYYGYVFYILQKK